VPCKIEEMTVELGSALHEIMVVFVWNIRGKNLQAYIDKDIIESAKDSFAPVLCHFFILRLDYPCFYEIIAKLLEEPILHTNSSLSGVVAMLFRNHIISKTYIDNT
jgi:hypothetical protein